MASQGSSSNDDSSRQLRARVVESCVYTWRSPRATDGHADGTMGFVSTRDQTSLSGQRVDDSMIMHIGWDLGI